MGSFFLLYVRGRIHSRRGRAIVSEQLILKSPFRNDIRQFSYASFRLLKTPILIGPNASSHASGRRARRFVFSSFPAGRGDLADHLWIQHLLLEPGSCSSAKIEISPFSPLSQAIPHCVERTTTAWFFFFSFRVFHWYLIKHKKETEMRKRRGSKKKKKN